MSWGRARLAKAALSALHYSGADGMLAPLTRGLGAIFMLHHVRPDKPGSFEPECVRTVTPDFLDQVIRQVRNSGFEVISLDAAHFRLTEGEYRQPFVCFTFDNGFRDNLDYAYPIFKRYDLPFAVYVATDYPDNRGDLWWVALERVVTAVNALVVKIDGASQRLKCGTPAEKSAAFETLYEWLRRIDEDDARSQVRELCAGAGVQARGLCGEQMMTWDELRQMAGDPRVTIGGRTRRHYALAKLTLGEARAEIEDSNRRIERELGLICRHLSYPYGDEASAGPREFELAREIGLKTAVTAHPSLIYRSHSGALTALPRIPLGGDYQRTRYVKVQLSGVPFALDRLGRRPAAAT
jgi:peptidoglycan/xylan/chitin deacetylase (PgdA/CDA1 family)